MNRLEFYEACKLSCCSVSAIEKYIHGNPKTDYTVDDTIAVYHMTDKPCVTLHGKAIGNGYYSDGSWSQGYTTKRYRKDEE